METDWCGHFQDALQAWASRLYALRGATSMEEYLRALEQSAGSSHVGGPCTASWDKGSIAYRCLTCQTIINGAVCVDCFKAGNHEGHDFLMYISDSGGCCDCGDPTSWRPSGFCPRHQAPTGAFRLSLTAEESALLQSLLHMVMRVVGLQCGLSDMDADARLLPSATWEGDVWTGIHWLKALCGHTLLRDVVVTASATPLHAPEHPPGGPAKLCRAGDEVAQRAQRALCGGSGDEERRRVCVWPGQRADGSVTFTEVTLGSLLNLPTTLQEPLASLYLLLLYNKRYKVEFGVQLLRNYSALVSAASNEGSRSAGREESDRRAEAISNILDRITVQVLHSSEVVMHLVRRACLFDVLLSTLRRQLQWSLDEGPQALRSQAYHRVLSDIKVALVPEAAVFLLSDATPVDTLGPWDGRVAPWQGHAGGVGQVDADTAPWARSAFDHLDRSALEDMCRVPLSHVQQAGQKLASVDAAQNGLGGLLGHADESTFPTFFGRPWLHFLYLLARLQHYELHTRRSGTHVEHVAPNWQQIISLEINMCNYVVLEVVNCLLGEGHAAFRAPDMDPGTLQRALGRGYAQTAAMLKWWEATWGHYLDGFAECLADGSYGRRLWTSHAQGSIHLPLHRSVASLYTALLRGSLRAPDVDASVLLLDNASTGPNLHLASAVFMNQVYHRQWIRNGQELLFIAAVYRKSDWAPYLLLPDLHGCHMHLAANVLRWAQSPQNKPFQWIFQTIAHAATSPDDAAHPPGALGPLEAAAMACWAPDAQHHAAVVLSAAQDPADTLHDLMRFAVAMLRETVHLQGLRQAFRRQIVHHLAREPSTFTSLNINLYEVDEQTLGTLLTQHLSEVADYAPASVHSEGRYSLKPAFWVEWDPLYVLYHSTGLQRALDNAASSAVWQPTMQLRHLPPLPEPYRSAFGVACLDPNIAGVCAVVIASCLHAPTAIAPQLCLVTLSLLHMTLTQALQTLQGWVPSAGALPTEPCRTAVRHMAVWVAEVARPTALSAVLEALAQSDMGTDVAACAAHVRRLAQQLHASGLEPVDSSAAPVAETQAASFEPGQAQAGVEQGADMKEADAAAQKRAAAAASKAKALAAMKAMQASAALALLAEDSTSEEEPEAMEERPCEGPCAKPTLPKHHPHSWQGLGGECALCQQGAEQGPLALMTLFQPTAMPSMALRRVPSTWQDVPAPPPTADTALAAVAPGLAVSFVDLCMGVHVLCCGHVIHRHCYLTAVEHQRARQRNHTLHEGERLLDPDKDELLCPLCRRVVNGLLPLTSPVLFSTAGLPVLSEVLLGVPGWGDATAAAEAVRGVRMVLLVQADTPGHNTPPQITHHCLGTQLPFWTFALSKASSVNLISAYQLHRHCLRRVAIRIDDEEARKAAFWNVRAGYTLAILRMAAQRRWMLQQAMTPPPACVDFDRALLLADTLLNDLEDDHTPHTPLPRLTARMLSTTAPPVQQPHRLALLRLPTGGSITLMVPHDPAVLLLLLRSAPRSVWLGGPPQARGGAGEAVAWRVANEELAGLIAGAAATAAERVLLHADVAVTEAMEEAMEDAMEEVLEDARHQQAVQLLMGLDQQDDQAGVHAAPPAVVGGGQQEVQAAQVVHEMFDHAVNARVIDGMHQAGDQQPTMGDESGDRAMPDAPADAETGPSHDVEEKGQHPDSVPLQYSCMVAGYEQAPPPVVRDAWTLLATNIAYWEVACRGDGSGSEPLQGCHWRALQQLASTCLVQGSALASGGTTVGDGGAGQGSGSGEGCLLQALVNPAAPEPCVDHVLTEGLVDMLPLHCPALPKNGPGALQAVLRDPFVLLLELLRQTCGPGGTDGKRAVYADDLRTLLLALIHVVYVPALCRAVLTVQRLHGCPSTASLAAVLAHAASSACATPPPQPTAHDTARTAQCPQTTQIPSEAGPSKRPRQHSPAPRQQLSSPSPHNPLDEDVARLLLPWLRRAAVLLALVLDAQPPQAPAEAAHAACALPEVEHWRALLRLPAWPCAVRSALAVPGADAWLRRWVGDLASGAVQCSEGPVTNTGDDGTLCVLRALPDHAPAKQGKGAGSMKASMVDQSSVDRSTGALRVPLPAAPRLLPLPRVCQDLYLHINKERCARCGLNPRQPTLCLTCGQLLCCEGNVCSMLRGDLALQDCCSDHAAVCGGGVGMFFLPLRTCVMSVRNDRLAAVASLYVDDHGEEDPLFQRGRSIFLQASRQEYATTLWRWAGFDFDTRLLRARGSALIPSHTMFYTFMGT